VDHRIGGAGPAARLHVFLATFPGCDGDLARVVQEGVLGGIQRFGGIIGNQDVGQF